jgi:hypothetical protein
MSDKEKKVIIRRAEGDEKKGMNPLPNPFKIPKKPPPPPPPPPKKD